MVCFLCCKSIGDNNWQMVCIYLYSYLCAFFLSFCYLQSWAPPKAHHNRLTLLKSVHIYKKHRVQYEVRTYFRHMTYERLTESTLKTFLEYIQRNVPEGVALKITKVVFFIFAVQFNSYYLFFFFFSIL